MNLIVLLIAAYLPLPFILFLILRSGSFGRGSLGTLFKLFFLGVASAVPAFLMEAGALLAVSILLRLFPEDASGGMLPVLTVVLKYVIVIAVIEECWKHFVLRVSTWKQMTMDTVGDGIAASTLVSAGFAAVMYGAWMAGYCLIPEDMEFVRSGMPEYLSAGPVSTFLFALLYIFTHFGYSGFMGALYGVAKGSEQKEHGGRAGFMLGVSLVLPILVHGGVAALTAYGFMTGQVLWLALGLAAGTLLGALMVSVLRSSKNEVDFLQTADKPVEFADSEEFAEFAEHYGADQPGLPENAGAEVTDYPETTGAEQLDFPGNSNAEQLDFPENPGAEKPEISENAGAERPMIPETARTERPIIPETAGSDNTGSDREISEVEETQSEEILSEETPEADTVDSENRVPVINGVPLDQLPQDEDKKPGLFEKWFN